MVVVHVQPGTGHNDGMDSVGPTLRGGCEVTLRVLDFADAEMWLAGEDEEQLRWFEMPAASIDDVVRSIEGWRASWAQGGAGFVLDGPADPWEYNESGVMLRYVLTTT